MAETRRHQRARRRLVIFAWITLVTVVVVGTSVVVVSSAAAHAILLRSEPADGAVLLDPPETVSLWFSEGVAPELSSASVLNSEGATVTPLDLRDVPRDEGRLDAPFPDLQPGMYSLSWRVFAEDDGHYSEGLLVFRLGAGTRPAVAAESGADSHVPIMDAALRWLDLMAMAALVGAVAVAGWVLSPATHGQLGSAVTTTMARRRVLRAGITAAGIGFIVGLGLLARQAANATAGTSSVASEGLAWVAVLETRWGTLWLVRQVLLVGLAANLLVVYRNDYRNEPTDAEHGRGGRQTPTLLAVSAMLAGLAFVHILAGHAAVTAHRSVSVVAGTVHLLAAAVWVGGLLALVIGWPRTSERVHDPEATRAYLRRFGRLALIGVGLVAATGLYYAGQQVASPDALITTLYGRALLTKVGVFLMAGTFGLANALLLNKRVVARLSRLFRRPVGWMPLSRVRSLVIAEGCLGVLVLAGAGVLGAAVPAKGPEFAPPAGPAPATLTQQVDDLLVTVSARPNQPGPNVFEVLTASTRRPAMAEVEQVRLRFTSAENRSGVTSPPLSRIEPGRYRLSGDFLASSGTWRVDTLIERSGLQASVARFDWAVSGSAPPRPVVLSSARLEPPLTWASAVALLSLAAAGVWLLLRGRLGAVPKQRVDVSEHEDALHQAHDSPGLTTLADRITQDAR